MCAKPFESTYMKLSRCFVKVYSKPRHVLVYHGFLKAFNEIEALAAAVEDTVVEDVRLALKGEKPNTASAASDDQTKIYPKRYVLDEIKI